MAVGRYVCPQCLVPYDPEEELNGKGVLTREHVPPRSLGGKRLALTCDSCNSALGGNLDSHMRLEADLYDFHRGVLAEIEATLRTTSGSIPIHLSCVDGTMVAKGVKDATHADNYVGVEHDFVVGAMGENWQNFQFHVEFNQYSPERAAVGWLRVAYLAFFAALGYRFVLRKELDVVRAKIRDPLGCELRNFRLSSSEFCSEPQLLRVEAPDRFRSYLLRYRNHSIFLPRYGDGTLYERLAGYEGGVSETFRGKVYPWPVGGPAFLHDYHSQPGA